MKRLVYERHTEILNDRMDVMLDNLRAAVDNGFQAAQLAYKEDLTKWGMFTIQWSKLCSAQLFFQRGQAEKTTEAGSLHPIVHRLTNVLMTLLFQDDDSGTPTSTPFVTTDGAEGNSARRERGDAPPQQRYKLSDEIRNLIWQLVTINNEMAAMTNTMQYVLPFCELLVLRVSSPSFTVNGNPIITQL